MNKPFFEQIAPSLTVVRTGIASVALAAGLTACGPSSMMLNNETGEPILIQESAYTASGCVRNLQEEADNSGMTLRSTDVKGSLFGDALLWPFVKGYVCIGTNQAIPRGIVGTTSLYRG